MGSNHEKVRQGERILLFALSDYVCKELKQTYGAHWWEDGVQDILYDDQKCNLPLSGDWPTLVDSLDMAVTLTLFDVHWRDIFSRKLPVSHRTWAKELKGVRNDLAHLGGKDFSDDDTWRALDTMARLCASIDADSAEEIREILRELRYGSAAGSMNGTAAVSAPKTAAPNTSGILQSVPVSSLPSWRDVIKPHPDVAAGRYKNAEFAADLAQVARGEGSFEYRDPVEFFARTYVTEGMAGLLMQALRRIGGKDGEPVSSSRRHSAVARHTVCSRSITCCAERYRSTRSLQCGLSSRVRGCPHCPRRTWRCSSVLPSTRRGCSVRRTCRG